ncbi:MAG: CPBP family intramembrane glutamic endopeptidase [Streptosporangiaceae bacterium]
MQRISARRAYLEVILVWALFFAASVVAGAETLAGRYPAPSGSWAVFGPAAISELASATLALLAVVLLSARRGVTPRYLGYGPPRKPDGRPAHAQALRLAVWAIGALLLGGVITSLLATGQLNQPTHQGPAYLVYATSASIAAGIIEESVVLAFLVTTLRQAGRPLLEIVAVAVVLRCSYHDYYGPGVIGIAIWAALFVWIYLRGGSILPLIVVHFLWDFTIFLGQQWRVVIALRGVTFLLLLPLAATVSWLVEVVSRHSAAGPPGYGSYPLSGPYGPPGPYGMPAGPYGAPGPGWQGPGPGWPGPGPGWPGPGPGAGPLPGPGWPDPGPSGPSGPGPSGPPGSGPDGTPRPAAPPAPEPPPGA